VIRDPKYNCALVEFERHQDAQWAWRRLDGLEVDRRAWKVGGWGGSGGGVMCHG